MTRPTQAQSEARARAWRIFRLRGLHAQCHVIMSASFRTAALNAVDMELKSLGAEPETERQERRRRDIQEKFA